MASTQDSELRTPHRGIAQHLCHLKEMRLKQQLISGIVDQQLVKWRIFILMHVDESKHVVQSWWRCEVRTRPAVRKQGLGDRVELHVCICSDASCDAARSDGQAVGETCTRCLSLINSSGTYINLSNLHFLPWLHLLTTQQPAQQQTHKHNFY